MINLPERADRRKSVEREFRNAGWKNYEFFGACRFDNAAGFKSPSWRGCFYSHLECLRIAEKRKLENILIIEDDIALSSSMARLTPDIIRKTNDFSWDLLYFGHEHTGDIGRATSKTSKITFERFDGDILTAHFYAVNKRVIPRLISHFEQNASTVPANEKFGPMSIDGAYNTFRRYNIDVNTFISNPKIGWQRPFRSDLSPSPVDDIVAFRGIIDMGRSVKYYIGRKLKRH